MHHDRPSYEPVRIDRGSGGDLADVLPRNVDEALADAELLEVRLPYPGEGRTVERFEALASIAAIDLEAVRAVEPHLDAAAILREAGVARRRGTYGVFAAEATGTRLEFRDGRLHGEKPWCSLADRLDRALVSAWHGQDRVLADVDLRQPEVRSSRDAWRARGLAAIPSGPVFFDGAPASVVGHPGWYLQRPGFAWGGVGVAACWHGGAVAIARRLAGSAGADPLRLAHLGAVDEMLTVSRLALATAACQIDADDGTTPQLIALRTRGIVARAAEEVMARVGRALGPGPLALEEEHAKRVADLQLYVRQHHAERDQAALGALVNGGIGRW